MTGNDGTLVRDTFAFERDFTQIPNDWLRDGQLSLKARGLLGLLMSHKPGYLVTVKTLAAQNPEGRDAIMAAVTELKSGGYLAIEKQRNRRGHIVGSVWRLTDPARKKRRSEPQSGYPESGYPESGYPESDNPRLKEAQLEEHFTTNYVGESSTRAGDEEVALTGGSSSESQTGGTCWSGRAHRYRRAEEHLPDAECIDCGARRRDADLRSIA